MTSDKRPVSRTKRTEDYSSPTIAAALKHEEKKIHSIDLSAKPIYPQVVQQNTSSTSHTHPTIAAANVNHEKMVKEMSEEKE
uniref:Uncharacterized protein n=1 Tax=Ditylenchus dipsaci TaxID=166011 RepID=A0A915E150_9BILA